jgi:hypothetical protein
MPSAFYKLYTLHQASLKNCRKSEAWANLVEFQFSKVGWVYPKVSGLAA